MYLLKQFGGNRLARTITTVLMYTHTVHPKLIALRDIQADQDALFNLGMD